MSQSIPQKTRVLVVDDHQIIRQGVALLVNNELDMEVCGEAATAEDGLRLIESHAPHAVIIDISLHGVSGIELIKRVRNRWPTLPILVLSMHEELLYAERSLRAGANGYLMKAEASDQIVPAIRKIVAGELCVSEKMASTMLRKYVQQGDGKRSSIEQLTDREFEVFQLIGQGFGTSQIAKKLHLSVKTIETYRANLKQKLNLKHANELVMYSSQWVQNEFAPRADAEPQPAPSANGETVA